MAFSFYSDELNDQIAQATNAFVSSKDMNLTNLIYRSFKRFVDNNQFPKFNEFSTSFDNIYSFSTGQRSSILRGYRTQRDINRDEAKQTFDEQGQEKVRNYKANKQPIFDEFNKNMQMFLTDLKMTSWQKLNSMINNYQQQVNLLPQVGEEVDI